MSYLFDPSNAGRSRPRSFCLVPQTPGGGVRPLGYLVLTRARGRACLGLAGLGLVPCSNGVLRGAGVAEVAAFAQRDGGDLDAVAAALREPWSNGQTEGQINRLKMLKRQMYGAAGIDLLLARLQHSA